MAYLGDVSGSKKKASSEVRVVAIAASNVGLAIAAGHFVLYYTLDDPRSSKWRVECERAALSVAFTDNGTEVASGGNDAKVTLRLVESSEVTQILPHTNSVCAVACCRSLIASGGDDNLVIIRRLDLHGDYKELHQLNHDTEVRAIAFSPIDERIATGGWGAKVIIA
jgi:WD40 repeat protein